MTINSYVPDISSRFLVWKMSNYGIKPNRSFHSALSICCLRPKRSPLSVSGCCHGVSITAKWVSHKWKTQCIIWLPPCATSKIENFVRFPSNFMGIYFLFPPIAAKLCKPLAQTPPGTNTETEWILNYRWEKTNSSKTKKPPNFRPPHLSLTEFI